MINSNIKVFLIGVSDYSRINLRDLYGTCIVFDNDVFVIKHALSSFKMYLPSDLMA